MKKAFAALALLCMLAMAACGSVNNSTSPAPTPTPAPSETPTPEAPAATPPYTEMLPSDAAIPVGNTVVVFNSSWTDPIGNLSSILLSTPASPVLARVTTDGSDAVAKSFGGRIYVVNRLGADSIQVIDPSNFSVAADYSVGKGSNPQDIAVVSDEKAYVSRLDSQNDTSDTGDVLVINPLTGAKLGSIDLKPYTDPNGNRLARAAQMVLVGKQLYVCIQDLPADMSKSASTNGKVAIIDTETDGLVDVDLNAAGTQVIELTGRDPWGITYSPLTDKLYVADSGTFVNLAADTSDKFGGIEVIDHKTNRSEGIVVDDAALGGGIYEVRIASAELGFTITSPSLGVAKIASFNPTTYAVVSKNVYTSPGFYLPDFTIDSQGRLLIAEQEAKGPGVVILNASDGSKVAGPVNVGAPPVSITFVDVQ
ncbi:MAG: hypothetical protein V2A66_03010 [Pseudomonadota bacterium]